MQENFDDCKTGSVVGNSILPTQPPLGLALLLHLSIILQRRSSIVESPVWLFGPVTFTIRRRSIFFRTGLSWKSEGSVGVAAGDVGLGASS